MSQPFADAPRALVRPVTLQTLGEPRVRLADDAAHFLRDTVLGGRKPGLLLQGRPLLGKTRFLAEWLRRAHPRMLVLAPEPGAPIPEAHPRLRRAARHGLCLFLDDLERFDDRVPEVVARLPHLKAAAESADGAFLILATVRDGGPSETVASGPAFRPILEGLDHVEIEPPSDDQRADAARRAPGTEGPGDERSFAFLLTKEFEIQRRRYGELVDGQTDGQRNALRRLKAAKVLDDRGIRLAPARVRGVAQALFGFDATHAEAADRVLRTLGFTDGQAFEPAFLKHVVQATSEGNLRESLREHLRAANDLAALVEWGRAQYLDIGSSPFVVEILAEALALGEASEVPGALVPAAEAGFALGYVLHMDGQPGDAAAAYGRAAKAGRAAGTPEGLAKAVMAEVNLGLLLEDEGDAAGARAAYGRAGEAGRAAGTPDGLVHSALAEINLGVLLRHEGDAAGARAAYGRAGEAGRAAGTPAGLAKAATAEFNLGLLLYDEGDIPGVRAAYGRAGEAGRAAGTPDGLTKAATAEVNLGVLLRHEGDAAGARAAYGRAGKAGRAAGTPDGLAKATMARFNFGNLLRQEGDVSGARAAYGGAVEMGRAAGTPEGLVEAARAHVNLGAIFYTEGDVSGAWAAFERAAKAGREAGTPEGAEVAQHASKLLETLAAEAVTTQPDAPAHAGEGPPTGEEDPPSGPDHPA